MATDYAFSAAICDRDGNEMRWTHGSMWNCARGSPASSSVVACSAERRKMLGFRLRVLFPESRLTTERYEVVTKCANPSCTTVFRYFRGGKLFAFSPNSQARTPDAEFHKKVATPSGSACASGAL